MLALLWLSCTPLGEESFLQCELDVALVPRVGAPGDLVEARGGPLTEVYDLAVRVGGVEATVHTVTRDCDACDDCLARRACSPCGDCTPACEETCATTCTESLTFEVPDLPPGPVTVVVIDGWGQSAPADFTVE